MESSVLRHQRIIANAGSGKTYRLTTRYIELLERQVPAERIVALTFTRKAAGEFLDSIFKRLAEASGSPKAARALAADTGMPGLSTAGCLAHLRQLIDKLPLLTLGTLDSFFGRILRAFPFECGLAGEVAILDDHWQGVVRRRLLADLFRFEAQNEEGFAEFLELIRKQGRNREGRNVTGALDREIEESHERFLLTPPDKPWGDPTAIWPKARPEFGHGGLLRLAEEFEREFFRLHPRMEEKHRADWQSRFREMRALHAGLAAPERLVRLAAQAISLPPGPFCLKGLRGKAFDFPDSWRNRAMALGRAILSEELAGRLARSRALYELLSRFETRYRAQVRDAGQLTFLDVAGLLAAAGGTTWGAKSLRPFTRQELSFRLDSSFDHWLLDEFQDTSRLQWQALRDLVDEVIQSDSGQRSFFYVGDTKQAIYAWRGGDPRLFDEIADFYNASGTHRIDTSEALDVSFRSVPEILEAVNTVFSPENLHRAAATLEFPGEVLARWASAWRVHEPHNPVRGDGCFEWRTFEVKAEVSKETLDEETAGLIAKIDPLPRGLSCGVLVRSNARILTVINALRKRGLPAASEGKFFAAQDSDLTAALLALLSFVAHPDDSLSDGHVRLTPLASLLGQDPHGFRAATLARIRGEGFHGVLADWLEELDLDAKPFARSRAEELLKVATIFDATRQGRAGVDDFVAFARGFVSLEDPATGAIRVLTIHAAKGLDFDMVVLPDIDSTWSLGRHEAPLHLHCGPDGRVTWGLDLPQKEICMLDPVLRQAWESNAAEQHYEDLCLSYVAMTRARRGLYLLSRRLSSATRCRDFNRLLHQTFSRDGKVLGNPAWYQQMRARASLIEEEGITPLAGEPQTASSPVLPSRAGATTVSAAALLGESSVLAAGSDLHRALAKISWLEDDLPDFTGLPGNVGRLLRNFLQTKTAMRLFTKPETPHALWRERAFDVMMGGQWISGAFDRVVVFLDAAGKPVRAEIYDFKTGQRDIASTYRDQMNLYRRSLSCLTGLAEEKISSTLVSVGTGDEIPSDGHPLVQGVFSFGES